MIHCHAYIIARFFALTTFELVPWGPTVHTNDIGGPFGAAGMNIERVSSCAGDAYKNRHCRCFSLSLSFPSVFISFAGQSSILQLGRRLRTPPTFILLGSLPSCSIAVHILIMAVLSEVPPHAIDESDPIANGSGDIGTKPALKSRSSPVGDLKSSRTWFSQPKALHHWTLSNLSRRSKSSARQYLCS
jgi:hypothetical protein